MAALTLKTEESLLRRLSESAKKKLTKEEEEKQRISFIYAGMPNKSEITKLEIKRVLSGVK